MDIKLTTDLTSDDMALLKRVYESSFPPEEQREWTQICHPSLEGRPKLYAILADGHLAGLITLWRFERFAYIEHLAIDPRLRGYGIGNKAIRLIIDRIRQSPLVVEIEPPRADKPETVSRHKFYQKLGFQTIEESYIQPPYADGLPSVALHLMATTPLPPQHTANTLHSEVYNKR